MDNKVIELIRQNKVFEPAALASVVLTETSGVGFDPETNKLVIRFESAYFSRLSPKSKIGLWKTGPQTNQEEAWALFNSAYVLDPQAAMRSTSIGLGQIMGDNYKLLGYHSVNDMWDDAKRGLDRQLYQLITFIENKKPLASLIKEHNWVMFAYYYNGPNYKKNSYDTKLNSRYAYYKKFFNQK